ncbi:MAG: hypothetical protein GW941_00725 [Candidatus Pacebacteria bacterium]|nr:hypothetical protein [Candidatus Paceibacterota bacterium]
MRERETGKQNNKTLIERIGQINNASLKVHDIGMNLPLDSKSSFNNLNPLVLKTIVQFLNAPTVTDRFDKDHQKRRDFYSVVEAESKDLSQWFETNRLRWNSIYEILMIIDLLLPADDRLKSIKCEVRELPVQSAEEYNNLSTEEKVATANKLASLTYKLYKLLII